MKKLCYDAAQRVACDFLGGLGVVMLCICIYSCVSAYQFNVARASQVEDKQLRFRNICRGWLLRTLYVWMSNYCCVLLAIREKG